MEVEGRKAWVEGRIETLPEDGKEPEVLVEAKALFIEPRQAAVCFLDREILVCTTVADPTTSCRPCPAFTK